jgi:hypothetical protein
VILVVIHFALLSAEFEQYVSGLDKPYTAVCIIHVAISCKDIHQELHDGSKEVKLH